MTASFGSTGKLSGKEKKGKCRTDGWGRSFATATAANSAFGFILTGREREGERSEGVIWQRGGTCDDVKAGERPVWQPLRFTQGSFHTRTEKQSQKKRKRRRKKERKRVGSAAERNKSGSWLAAW